MKTAKEYAEQWASEYFGCPPLACEFSGWLEKRLRVAMDATATLGDVELERQKRLVEHWKQIAKARDERIQAMAWEIDNTNAAKAKQSKRDTLADALVAAAKVFSGGVYLHVWDDGEWGLYQDRDAAIVSLSNPETRGTPLKDAAPAILAAIKPQPSLAQQALARYKNGCQPTTEQLAALEEAVKGGAE